MVCKWSKVREIATLELGYTEGKNNWTKYARDLDAISYFNGPKQNVAWCMTYPAWCIVKASDKTTALKVQYQPSKDNCGCGVKWNAQYYKDKKRFFKDPKPGDIFFTKNWGHGGFVLEVFSDGTFRTNEGNHNDKVDSIIRKVSDMEGFGRPNYDPEDEPVPEKEVDIVVKVTAPEGVKVNIKVEN